MAVPADQGARLRGAVHHIDLAVLGFRGGTFYCCVHCTHKQGVEQLRDRV